MIVPEKYRSKPAAIASRRCQLRSEFRVHTFNLFSSVTQLDPRQLYLKYCAALVLLNLCQTCSHALFEYESFSGCNS